MIIRRSQIRSALRGISRARRGKSVKDIMKALPRRSMTRRGLKKALKGIEGLSRLERKRIFKTVTGAAPAKVEEMKEEIGKVEQGVQELKKAEKRLEQIEEKETEELTKVRQQRVVTPEWIKETGRHGIKLETRQRISFGPKTLSAARYEALRKTEKKIPHAKYFRQEKKEEEMQRAIEKNYQQLSEHLNRERQIKTKIQELNERERKEEDRISKLMNQRFSSN